jgi:hypothetical protein
LVGIGHLPQSVVEKFAVRGPAKRITQLQNRLPFFDVMEQNEVPFTHMVVSGGFHSRVKDAIEFVLLNRFIVKFSNAASLINHQVEIVFV